MPRRARVVVPGVPVHIIQRGHDCQPVFFCDDDYWRYLQRSEIGVRQFRLRCSRIRVDDQSCAHSRHAKH